MYVYMRVVVRLHVCACVCVCHTVFRLHAHEQGGCNSLNKPPTDGVSNALQETFYAEPFAGAEADS